MAYTQELWLKARGYFEAGLSLAEINSKTGISKSKVSERAKKEQWERGKNLDYIKAHELIVEKREQQNGTPEGDASIDCADEIAKEKVALIKAQAVMKTKAFTVLEKIIDYTGEVFDKKQFSKVETEREYYTDKEDGLRKKRIKSETSEAPTIDGHNTKAFVESIDKALIAIGVNQRHANVNINNNNQNQAQAANLSKTEIYLAPYDAPYDEDKQGNS